jgi:arsenate reductase-like glutaredoxin family protein
MTKKEINEWIKYIDNGLFSLKGNVEILDKRMNHDLTLQDSLSEIFHLLQAQQKIIKVLIKTQKTAITKGATT